VEVLAPANSKRKTVFHQYAPWTTANCRITLRAGACDGCEVVFLKDREERELAKTYTRQCAACDGYWKKDRDVVKMLDVEEIDHLRHPQFPLDVQVGLLGKDDSLEVVWMRLSGFSGKGKLKARLLNQPAGPHAAKEGDELEIVAVKGEDGVVGLYTSDEGLLKPKKRKWFGR